VTKLTKVQSVCICGKAGFSMPSIAIDWSTMTMSLPPSSLDCSHVTCSEIKRQHSAGLQ
ncbi:unnamed protein product, partial [Staurois parvus]